MGEGEGGNRIKNNGVKEQERANGRNVGKITGNRTKRGG